MFSNQEVARLERELRGADAQVKASALDRIIRLATEDRMALLALHNTAFSPLLLGALLALEQGATLDAPSLERVAVETLAHALGGRDETRRIAACNALIHGNVSHAPVQPILVRLARDRRATVRSAVAGVLSWGDRLETDDVGLVEQMLRDPWLRIAGAATAAHLLERLLRAMAAAIERPKGKATFRAIPPDTRGSHVDPLVGGLRPLPDLGASLVAALGARDSRTRLAAVRGLETIGAAQAAATAPLFRALADREPRVSQGAFRALAALKRIIDVDRAPLRRMLRSKRTHVRANSVRVLPFTRTTPPFTWEPFTRALDDPAEEVQQAAAQTLRERFWQVPPELLARLRQMAAARPRTSIGMNAAHSVAHLASGDAVAEAVTSLIAGLRSPITQVRKTASWSISCLGQIAIRALPELMQIATSDPDLNVRYRALWAFRKMGPSAQAAVPLLEQLLADPDPDVRRFAGQALEAVRAKTSTAS